MNLPELTPFRLKMGYGYLLLIILGLLGRGIGLNQVTEANSFGLKEIISALLVLSGAWAGWAFNAGGADKDKE